MKDAGVRVFLLEGNQFDIQDVLLSAKNETMLVQEYSFILSNEYNHDIVLASNVDSEITDDPPNMDGIFQVRSALPSTNTLVKDQKREWEELVKTTERANRSCTTYAAGQAASIGTVGCFSNSEYWSGTVPRTFRHLSERVPELPSVAYDSVQCLDSLAHVFHHNIKEGITTLESINDRRGTEQRKETLIEIYDRNISSLVNNASSTRG